MKSAVIALFLVLITLLVALPSLAFIDDVIVPPTVTAGEPFQVIVFGSLESSCLELTGFGSRVNNEVITLNINRLDTSEPGTTCLAVILPYDVFEEVTVPTPGLWLLRVIEYTYGTGGGDPSTRTDEVEIMVLAASGEPLPDRTMNRLHDAYPNPFNPITRIKFSVTGKAPTTIRVHDLAGRVVKTLIENEALASGSHEVTWNGTDEGGRTVAAGVYVYRMDSGTFTQMKRMVLVK